MKIEIALFIHPSSGWGKKLTLIINIRLAHPEIFILFVDNSSILLGSIGLRKSIIFYYDLYIINTNARFK